MGFVGEELISSTEGGDRDFVIGFGTINRPRTRGIANLNHLCLIL